TNPLDRHPPPRHNRPHPIRARVGSGAVRSRTGGVMNVDRMGRVAVVVFAAALAVPAAAQQVTMMTGPQGGSWIPLGGALKNMWETAIPGLQIQQQPGAGIANVRGIDEGKAQIGFGN